MIEIAVFGGSFNPSHKGHRQIAEYVMSQNIVNDIHVVPAIRNPFKESCPVSFGDRVRMCELTFEGMENVIVNPIERVIASEFNMESVRTIDLLDYMSDECPGFVSMKYMPLVGADCLAGFRRWKEWERILDEYGLIVVSRAGTRAERIEHPNIRYLDIPKGREVSSSMVRETVREGKSTVKYLVPGVREYIKEKKLYVS